MYGDKWDATSEEQLRSMKRVKVDNGRRVDEVSPRAYATGMGGVRALDVVERMARIAEAMSGPVDARREGERSIPTPQSWTGAPAVYRAASVAETSRPSHVSLLGKIDIKERRTRYIAPGDKLAILDHVSFFTGP